jgi:hypothetical protein
VREPLRVLIIRAKRVCNLALALEATLKGFNLFRHETKRANKGL